MGSVLLEALNKSISCSSRQVILGGHDRGARICHRLTVDKNDWDLDIVGTILLDIIPTKVQWEAFANPATCVGYFHWPFLANVQLAGQMLRAFGGAQWCRSACTRMAGTNEAGLQRLHSDNAIDVYAELFDQEATLLNTCEDYAAGAAPESEVQAEDQKSGKKLDVPTLVMFSKAKLGAASDVANIWEDWVQPGKLKAIGVGDGYGHYLPEEAADQVSEAVLSFISQFQ